MIGSGLLPFAAPTARLAFGRPALLKRRIVAPPFRARTERLVPGRKTQKVQRLFRACHQKIPDRAFDMGVAQSIHCLGLRIVEGDRP